MGSEESGWVDVTSGVGAGTKGAYEELIASTLFASTWMAFQVWCELTASDSEFDIATGDPGSEVIILDDQHYHWRNNSGGAGRGNTFSFPMTVPQGTRLSVRLSDGQAGATLHQHTLTISDFTVPVDIKSTSDSSGKVIIACGLPAGQYGSWFELIAATSVQRGWMVVSMFTSIQNREIEMDIGIGSGGNEVPLMNDLAFKKSDQISGGVTHSVYIYFPIDVPEGTRISCRAKDDSIFATVITVGAFVT